MHNVISFLKQLVLYWRSLQIHLYEKVFLLVLPIIGAFIACFDLIMLLSNTRKGRTVLYHEWLVRCSQLLVWVRLLVILRAELKFSGFNSFGVLQTSILLVSRFGCWLFVLSNRVLCFWWIMKPVLAIPALHAVFSSLEVLIQQASHIIINYMRQKHLLERH